MPEYDGSRVLRLLRAWAVHHPRVVDGLLACLVAALTLPATIGGAQAPGVLEPGTGITGVGWLWFVAVYVPLVWRRRAPTLVFWATLAIAAGCVLTGYTGVFLIFAPLVALYTVARRRPHRELGLAAATCVAAFGAALSRSRPDWPTLIGLLSVLAATSLLGITFQLRERNRAERVRHLAQEAANAERARIAREMHDIVAHSLVVMVALADGASISRDPNRTTELMEKTATTGRKALADMRRLLGLLRDGDAERAPLPGTAVLPELIDRIQAAGLKVTVSNSGQAPELSPGLGLAICRIVQEALTNTLKHAGPQAHADVRLTYTRDAVDIEVTDDGTGRPPLPGGHGLSGIKEYTAAYGGHAEVGPADGTGWRVHAHLPLTGSEVG